MHSSIAAVTLLLATVSTNLQAQEVPAASEAQQFLSHQALATRTLEPTVVREATVEVRSDILETSKTLSMDLFEGLTGKFELVDLELRAAGDLAWRGRLLGSEGQATITLKNGVVMGLIYAFGHAYELTADQAARPVLRQLDQSQFPPCANEHHADEPRGLPPMPPMLREGNSRANRGAIYNVDLLSLYTPQARTAAGGAAQIEATIQAAVDNSNTAAINSNAAVRFTLVGTEQANYDDSGNVFADRNWIQADPTVNGLRDTYSADLVSLIVENGGGGCGVAFLMGNEDPAAFSPFGYQVTDRGCAVGNLTFAHEHGHNMGLQHNPENGAPPAQTIFDWSYGHYNNGSYRTVMSYSSQCTSGCTRVTQFSNPDVTFNGLPTGIADERHNQRTIGLIAPYTADYRAGNLFVDGFESGGTGAWTSN